MPYKINNTFKPNILLKNKHVNTIYRYLFSKVKVNFIRTRIETNDNDFIDLDISSVKSDKVVILIHGLEGSSDSNYIKSATALLNKDNYDVVAFNMRGCSGEPNKLLSAYHSGKTDDLLWVIQYLEKELKYKRLHIVGYSLGGNVAFKFMGEYAEVMPSIVKSTIGVSVPCDLKGSSISISAMENRIYMEGFLKTLRVKALEKMARFPEANLDKEKILKSKNFMEFDDVFTAPIHGFKDADDYWKQCSCKQFIPLITQPTLLISSKDDPFLNDACFPIKEAHENKHFTFMQTNYGGHIGFVAGFNMKKQRFIENEILEFIQKTD